MIIPLPSHQEDDVASIPVYGADDTTRIKIFLDVSPWKCPACRLTNFGRNTRCADFKCKEPRPNDFQIRGRNE